MNWYNLNIQKLVVDYLGRLFGKNIQQRWCYTMVSPLVSLWVQYDNWRKRQFYSINITSQVFSLKNFLNDELDVLERRMDIITELSNDGLFISNDIEANPSLDIGLSSEVNDPVSIAATFDYDASNNFIITAPLSLTSQHNKIVALVQAKKAAGRVFKVRFE